MRFNKRMGKEIQFTGPLKEREKSCGAATRIDTLGENWQHCVGLAEHFLTYPLDKLRWGIQTHTCQNCRLPETDRPLDSNGYAKP